MSGITEYPTECREDETRISEGVVGESCQQFSFVSKAIIYSRFTKSNSKAVRNVVKPGTLSPLHFLQQRALNSGGMGLSCVLYVLVFLSA